MGFFSAAGERSGPATFEGDSADAGDQPILLHQVSIAKLFADVSQQTICNWIHTPKTLEILRLAAPALTGLNGSRVDTRFKLSKYCPYTERTVENCGSPSLGFGEPLDFSFSFRPGHSVAWSAAFQIMFKNNEEFSFFELLRDVFSKRFHAVFCAA